MSVIFGAFLFLLAGMWEAHVSAFLPGWGAFYPVWPLVVMGLCLEARPVRLAAGLALALVWEQLALPALLPPINLLWFVLLLGATWLLRVWLSHRSVWSAFVLVVLGRLVWIIVRFIDFSSFQSGVSLWQLEGRLWLATIIWDIVCILLCLPLALFINKRLAPYLPRAWRSDQYDSR